MSENEPGWALVTGASRGIGRAIAHELARAGYQLILTSRSREDLKACRLTLPHAERHAIEVADLSRAEEIEALYERVSPVTPAIDLLVLNAGAAIAAPLEQTSVEEWDNLFAVNVRAPFLLAKYGLPLLRRARAARIIVIGSVVSIEAYPNQGAYVASKHALRGFTRVLAQEVHDEGIIVQSVLPGGVGTDMVRRMRPDIDTSDLIQPEDVAAACMQLLGTSGNGVVDEIRIRRRGKRPS